jgi:hypothetical protein
MNMNESTMLSCQCCGDAEMLEQQNKAVGSRMRQILLLLGVDLLSRVLVHHDDDDDEARERSYVLIETHSLNLVVAAVECGSGTKLLEQSITLSPRAFVLLLLSPWSRVFDPRLHNQK